MAGTFYNLMLFTLFGMETGLLTCLVTFALADSSKCIHKKRGRLTPMLWFAPAVLVRLDVIPVMLFVFAFLYFSVKKGRGRLILGLLLVVFVLLIHFLWRHHFYGEWLPNTFYLKATGWPLKSRIRAGIRDTFWTGVTLGFSALLALIAMLKPKRWHFLLFGSFALYVAYQLYIGGDIFSLNRFVLPASLGLFVLAAEGIHRLMILFIERKGKTFKVAVCVALTLFCMLTINIRYWDHYLFLKRPQSTPGNRVNIRYVIAIEKVADADASVAVGAAGAFPYFSGRLCFDMLGKCDPYIARLPAFSHIRLAGHNKYDILYTIKNFKPEIVLHASDMNLAEFRRLYHPVIVEVDGMKLPFCVRNDSSKVRGCRNLGWVTFQDHFWEVMRVWDEDF
jgi:hypothetical protein